MTYQGVRYPDFVSATHYGSGDGLCGWNCRHDFWPFWPGLSTPNHTDEELEALNAKTIEYNGQMYSEYEISQMQRAAERKVRAAKRTYLAEDAAGVDTTKAAVKLKQARQQLSQFIQDTGAYPFDSSARTSVAGFGRSEASKAVWAARKNIEKYSEVRYNKDGTVKVTDDWKDLKKPSIPAYFKPNAIIETQTTFKNGTVQIDRSFYDGDAWLKEQIHSGNHNKPHTHKFGKDGNEPFHKHLFIRTATGVTRDKTTYSLTDADKAANKDIIWKVSK
jgi:hypothetical protein